MGIERPVSDVELEPEYGKYADIYYGEEGDDDIPAQNWVTLCSFCSSSLAFCSSGLSPFSQAPMTTATAANKAMCNNVFFIFSGFICFYLPQAARQPGTE